MKYLLCSIVFCCSISGYATLAQANPNPLEENKKQEFKYNDDNVKRGDAENARAEHAKEWMKTAKPSSPADVNVFYVQQTAFEKQGIKEICLWSMPKIESQNHSALSIKPDGSVSFSIFPVNGELWDLTKDKATKLLGMPTFEGKEGSMDVCSYQLCGATGANGSEIEVYHLDCEFKNAAQLSRYRVRSSGLAKSTWVSLEKK